MHKNSSLKLGMNHPLYVLFLESIQYHDDDDDDELEFNDASTLLGH